MMRNTITQRRNEQRDENWQQRRHAMYLLTVAELHIESSHIGTTIFLSSIAVLSSARRVLSSCRVNHSYFER
jgi:hypothetical protein